MNQTPIFLAYGINGPPNAAAIVNESARAEFLSSLSLEGQEETVPIQDARAFLERLGDRPRIYLDALIGGAVELMDCLPLRIDFDDFRTLSKLLNVPIGECPEGKQRTHTPLALRRMRAMWSQLEAGMRQNGLEWAYRNIELPTRNVTLMMTFHGVLIDQEQLRTELQQAEEGLQQFAANIQSAVHHIVDIGNDAAIRQLLFEVLGLQPVELTPGGLPSIKLRDLECMRSDHPAVRMVIDGINFRTRRNVFSAITAHLSPDGITRPILDPWGTTTGRFTCVDPPLQTLSECCRHVVVATAGNVLLEVDISEADLRSAAALSQDPALVALLHHRGADPHTQTASLVLGKPPTAICREERSRYGKILNIGLLYGLSPERLARNVRIPLSRAHHCFAALRQAYPGLFRFIDATGSEFLRKGCVRTWFRRLSWRDPDKQIHGGQGVAGAVQGTTSDLIKLAMGRLITYLPDAKLRLMNHDSVLLEVPKAQAVELAGTAVAVVETPPSGFPVPIFAKAKIGSNWRDMQEVRPPDSVPSHS